MRACDYARKLGFLFTPALGHSLHDTGMVGTEIHKAMGNPGLLCLSHAAMTTQNFESILLHKEPRKRRMKLIQSIHHEGPRSSGSHLDLW